MNGGEARRAAESPVPFGAGTIHDDLVERLLRGIGAAAAEWWVPHHPIVVLGRSSTAEREVRVARCRAEGVPIVRRLGGGGAVVLDPGTLCLTAAWRRDGAAPAPVSLFRRLTEALAGALAGLGLAGVRPEGTGDLAVNGRKIAGSSLYFGLRAVLFQASVLVDPDLPRIARLLRHPSREPSYRAGRPHEEFLTTLQREGWTGTVESLGETLARAMETLPLTGAPGLREAWKPAPDQCAIASRGAR